MINKYVLRTYYIQNKTKVEITTLIRLHSTWKDISSYLCYQEKSTGRKDMEKDIFRVRVDAILYRMDGEGLWRRGKCFS